MSQRGSEGRSESLSYKVVIYIVLIAGVVPIVLPFYWLVISSLKTKERVEASPPDWLPVVPKDYVSVADQWLRVKIFDDGERSGTYLWRAKALNEFNEPLEIDAQALTRTSSAIYFAQVDEHRQQVELVEERDDGTVVVALPAGLRTAQVRRDQIVEEHVRNVFWSLMEREVAVEVAEQQISDRAPVTITRLLEDLRIDVSPQAEIGGEMRPIVEPSADGHVLNVWSQDDDDVWQVQAVPVAVTGENAAAGYLTVRPELRDGGFSVSGDSVREVHLTRVYAEVDDARHRVKIVGEGAAPELVEVEVPGIPVERVIPASALTVSESITFTTELLGQEVEVRYAGAGDLPVAFDAAGRNVSAGRIPVEITGTLAVVPGEGRTKFEAPLMPQWENFARAWQEKQFDLFLANTILVAVLVVLGTVMSCGLVGYAFARLQFRGSNFLFFILLATMMIPGQVTSIPTFVLFASIGWIDTFLPLIVPHFLAHAAFFVFLYRQFMMTIPVDLEDSARIDGCGPLATWWLIMMPLSKPIIVTVAVFSFIASWNDFLMPLLYINSDSKQTIALALNNFKSSFQYAEPQLLMAGAVMMLIPTIIIFFLAQKVFIRGVVVTGVKG
jgi:multiple sugar transport system permease protein/sn-glycerol 3-phosphate transport system permease protein